VDISEHPSRPKLLLWLAALVVVFGAVSWLVTGGAGMRVTPLKPSHPALITLGPTPMPLVCAPNELALTGVVSECATAAPGKTSTCSVRGHVLDALLRLAGSNQAFLLYIEVKGTYTGPGVYYLPQWKFGLDTNDVPKVAVRQYTTGASWQSVAGVLSVTGRDGRSGTVSAILQVSNGTAVVPGPTLSVNGPWSCP
jgi:hypothetical protein